MGSTHTNTVYTHNRVIIKKGGGSQRRRRREQGSRESYSHKGGGDGNRVQGRFIHIKEEETGTGLKGGLDTHVFE